MREKTESTIAFETRHGDAARLHSPSAARNRDAVGDLLAKLLPVGGEVLEIGSGTGEHAVAACRRRPDISWQPSDRDAASRDSQDAWAAQSGAAMRPALDLDLLAPDWDAGLGLYDALVCLNVIHIAPWAVAETLARVATQHVSPGGFVFLYGPFLEGDATAQSNLAFDQSLRSRDPAWGVRSLREVEALFAGTGWLRHERHEMPANNLSLVFRHRSAF